MKAIRVGWMWISHQWSSNKSRHAFPKASAAFQAPFWSSLLIGSILASLFYAAIVFGGLDFAILRRYAMCHLVAEVSVYLFLIAIVSIVHKLWLAKRESRSMPATQRAIRGLIESAPEATANETAAWLETMWKAQSKRITDSWLGRRITDVVARQTARGNCRYLEEDLKDLAGKDADVQHDSYGLVRIISWAMPMFGFLGTVIGISETLGQMDTKSLASGSQEAMDSLTAGLYVAFDTTAVGLVLTMFAMFAMFGVGRVETRLLESIDGEVADNLQGLLSEDEAKPQDVYRVEQTVRLVSDQFLHAVERLVEKQASVWKETIAEAHQHWSTLVQSASDTSRHALAAALGTTMDNFVQRMDEAQKEGAAQIDARYHQWQSTLSDQTRSMHHHHDELIQHTELLTQLIDKCDALRAIEDGLQQNLTRLTDIDRFHEVAICLTEAVAVLGTQMERAGHLRAPKLRRVGESPAKPENLRRAA